MVTGELDPRADELHEDATPSVAEILREIDTQLQGTLKLMKLVKWTLLATAAVMLVTLVVLVVARL